ncbi:hypothetical protein APHAL10511_008252 [Amanita phalloides]|nr:hypothetical protein APHAL10511_008252 [Amanita phalloides]
MSSNDEDDIEIALTQGSKKRRIQRACDICRRKKIRCDGGQMPDNRCSNCVTYNLPCTYVEAAKKRGPPKGYVESLENRVAKLEKLLQRICPDKELLKEINSSLDSLESFQSPTSAESHIIPNAFVSSPRDIATSAIRNVNGVLKEEPEDDDMKLILADNLRRLSIDPQEYRFFGKSSGAMLIQTAMELKDEYTSQENNVECLKTSLRGKRPEYWAIKPWEESTAISRLPNTYSFPPDDLVTSLIDLYFKHVNLFFPLLHRPTFERCVVQDLHHTNIVFGAVLLLVCAVGSRHSDDPRVLIDGDHGHHSSGWKWFEQVQIVRRSLLEPPGLYDLQLHCLAVQYLQATSAPHASWTMVGIGIRLAQDVGVHRRKKVHTTEWTVDDELRKRAFWVLVCMDRGLSCALGRPCAIQDEDFDADYPLEVDDEYLDHPDPNQRFKQPPGRPSLMTAFNLFIKLNQLLAFTLRTIYSINKSKVLLGFVGEQWEQHIVAELDSALNRWVDCVPDFLRWDPKREDPQFFQQSVLLYTTYYHLQILVHRPFIPSSRKPSALAFPSLAICTNAARSCSHVVDWMRRRGFTCAPWTFMAGFTAGIVLLLNIWGGKRSGLSTDTQKEMSEVHKCMSMLRSCEERYYTAGRLWDILYELASVGELPLPQLSPPGSNKRERDEDISLESSPSPAALGTDVHEEPRPIVGSRRVSRVASQAEGAEASQSRRYHLPMYSDELGRLPLHGQMKFVASAGPQSNQIGSPQTMGNQAGSWTTSPMVQMTQQQLPQMQFSQAMGMGDTPGLVYSQMISPMMDIAQRPRSLAGAMHNQPLLSAIVGMNPPLNDNASFAGGGEMQAFDNFGLPIDNDAMAMWSNAPAGFELDDWGTYLNNLSELTHAMPSSGIH